MWQGAGGSCSCMYTYMQSSVSGVPGTAETRAGKTIWRRNLRQMETVEMRFSSGRRVLLQLAIDLAAHTIVAAGGRR